MDDIVFKAMLAVYLNKKDQLSTIQKLTEPLTGGISVPRKVLLGIRKFIKRCTREEIVYANEISPNAWEDRIARRMVYGVRDILEINGISCDLR